MREIKPYKTLQGAKASLDNGGRFFNLLTRAGDDRITNVELAKAAGVFLCESHAFVFLDMSLRDLPDSQRLQVLSLLERKLAGRYQKHGPRSLSASAANLEGQPGTLAVVEGYPQFVADQVQKRMSFIMVGTVFIPIVVEDHFQTYELYQGAAARGAALALAVPRATERLEKAQVRFGGVLREFTFEGNPKKKGVFLEPLYYTKM
ncbi:MAG: hypothetical protein ACR2FY_10510 [Pirellulaceae bacterium]